MTKRPCPVHTTPVLACLVCQGLTLPKRPGKLVRLPSEASPSAPRAGRSEHEEQADFVAWCNGEGGEACPELRECFAIPNGARTAMSVAKRLKAEGLRKGYPDVALDVARGGYHGLRIEFKRADGTPSDVDVAQREWHKRLALRGFKVVVAFGCEQAKEAARAYLAQPATVVKYPPRGKVA